MARLVIEVYPGGSPCEGGIALEGIRVFPMVLSMRTIELRIGRKSVFLNREEALEIAEALRGVALDG